MNRNSNAQLPFDGTILGTIDMLPQTPRAVMIEGPLAATDQLVTIRQALDAAEQEFGLSDAQIDPQTRVVPAVVSVGLSPNMQHMKVLVVTFAIRFPLFGRRGVPAMEAHKFCVLVDARTGKYIMGYAALPYTPVSS